MWYWFVLDLLPQVLEQRANQVLRQGLQPIFVCRFWGFGDQLGYKERHLWKISAVLWDEAFWRLKTSEHLGRKSLMAWSFWLSSFTYHEKLSAVFVGWLLGWHLHRWKLCSSLSLFLTMDCIAVCVSSFQQNGISFWVFWQKASLMLGWNFWGLALVGWSLERTLLASHQKNGWGNDHWLIHWKRAILMLARAWATSPQPSSM